MLKSNFFKEMVKKYSYFKNKSDFQNFKITKITIQLPFRPSNSGNNFCQSRDFEINFDKDIERTTEKWNPSKRKVYVSRIKAIIF